MCSYCAVSLDCSIFKTSSLLVMIFIGIAYLYILKVVFFQTSKIIFNTSFETYVRDNLPFW